MIQLRPYQQDAITAVYRHLQVRDDNPVVVLPTGCHVAGHPILMFDGSLKPVEEVLPGDQIMGPDSQPRIVQALCGGEGDLYRIVPTKGEPFIVNDEHVLSLVCTNENKRWPSGRRGGEIDNISVRDYLSKAVSWRHLRKLYRTAVDFPNRPNLPIPPYVLGLLLGDGCLRDGVTLTTKDDAIAREWSDYVTSIGNEIVVKDHGGRCPTYAARYGSGHRNILTESLKALGLFDSTSENKFVPQMYLTASRDDRRSLLAGLIDTDGACHRAGFEYLTASRQLASDIIFLARSLGLASFCQRKYCICQTGAGGWYWRVSIYGDAENIPVRLARKRPARRRMIKSVTRTGFSVEPAGRGRFYGFELDGDHLYVDGHFVVHHNSGKTPLLSTICRDAVERWNGRVLIVSHVKELLQQAVDKLKQVCPELPVGVYSAGLNRRDTAHRVIVAGIQSIYKRACELDAFDLIIVDESHLIPTDGDGMYRQFLAEAKVLNPHLRVIGLTATPYRLDAGPICSPGHFLNTICYEIGIKELIRDGFLCPLVSKSGVAKVDTSSLHVRGGEFVADEVENLMDQDAVVEAACREIVDYTRDRNACLIFAASVNHGRHVAATLQAKHGIECGFVCGDTPAGERDEQLARFRGGKIDGLFPRPPLKYLCNVNVLTTGFDAPHIDCVALLRPTMSPGLYYQMVGRGFRLHPGKRNCLVLDFGGNVLRHGPVDQLKVKDKAAAGAGEAPAKECPECRSVVAAGYAACPECGFVFPVPQRQSHEARASEAGVLSGQVTNTQFRVTDVYYSVHTKRGASDSDPKSMRVDYKVGWHEFKSEWICFEHDGYARQRAIAWWKRRSPDPVPDTAERAVALAQSGAVAATAAITVRAVAGEPYERITDYELGEMPEPLPAGIPFTESDDSVPF